MNKRNIVLLSIGFLGLFLFILMYILVLNASEPLTIDYAVRDFCYSIRGEKYNFCYWFFRIITEFGYLYFVVALGIIAIFLFRLDNRFFIYVFILVLATALQIAIKDNVSRTRPIETMRWVSESSTSFPSGHSMTSGVISSYFIFLIWESKHKKRDKGICISIISVIYLLVIISRLILGVHYFSDVIAGVSLGIFMGIIGIFIYLIFDKLEILNTPLIFKDKDNWVL